MLAKKTRFTWLDAILLVLIVAGAAYLIHRVAVGLSYHWDWAVIPQYLYRYDEASGSWVPNLLMQGLFTTIRLSVWATLLATILGGLAGLSRLSGSLFRRLVSRGYVESVRNLPPLVLVFIFYFFISQQVLPYLGLEAYIRTLSDPSAQEVIAIFFAPAARMDAFVSALVTLAVYEGAYITEIVRAGVESVEKGQWEASYALGLSWRQQMGRVILPQALPRVLPPLAGQFISTIKDSAIVSVISIGELTFQGLELMSATYLTFEVWITITAMYLILTLGLSLGVRWLEVRLGRQGG